VGSKELTCFQKASRHSAFFLDRGREGLSPKGRATHHWWSLAVAAGQPLVYPLLKLLAHIMPNSRASTLTSLGKSMLTPSSQLEQSFAAEDIICLLRCGTMTKSTAKPRQPVIRLAKTVIYCRGQGPIRTVSTTASESTHRPGQRQGC
jgi:hypothetical protein